MEVLFVLSLFVVAYSYFGYFISICVISLFKKKGVKRSIIHPGVTFIVAARNEEKRIKRKIENTLALVYPKDSLQIIIASDASEDSTNTIIESYSSHGIELLNIRNRGGKENAQKEALMNAKGEIIVFTDVATMLEPYGLERIVSNFADPAVGCVSSEDRIVGKDGKPGGEDAYVRYEMLLRRKESLVNSLVGLSGSFFAARKLVCQDFSGVMQSDFTTLLKTVKIGLRGVVDPEVIGIYSDVSNPKKEFERKIRTVLRGITVYFEHKEFLNVFKYGIFSYQYFCHKLLRWLTPVFLCIVLVTNLFLAIKSSFYLFILLVQISFYGMAVFGWKSTGLVSHRILKIPTYFLIVNASILIAWWRYLMNERIIMWNPSER